MREEIFIHDSYYSESDEKKKKNNSKMKTMELKMKHLIAVSSKVNVRLNACKIGLSRIGNSVGVERKVEDEEDDDDEEDEEEEEAVGGGV